MGGRLRAAFLLVVIGIFLGVTPAKTQAQCGIGLIGLGGVNGMVGNPFRAEVKQTFLHDDTAVVHTIHLGMQRVARDTQGRLRIERNSGKFKLQNASGEQVEEERHIISICDLVKGEGITLDTLDKTATIQKMSRGALHARITASASGSSFCSRELRIGVHFPGTVTEDLGHRTIEGFDAEGVRAKRTVPNSFTEGTAPPIHEATSVTETWCSEELGAVLLRTMGTEEKGMTQTIAMVNIQRGEPDESLFQTPPDYRILERVNEASPSTGVGAMSGFTTITPAEQPAVSGKP